jgi:hypothetical protein
MIIEEECSDKHCSTNKGKSYTDIQQYAFINGSNKINSTKQGRDPAKCKLKIADQQHHLDVQH